MLASSMDGGTFFALQGAVPAGVVVSSRRLGNVGGWRVCRGKLVDCAVGAGPSRVGGYRGRRSSGSSTTSGYFASPTNSLGGGPAWSVSSRMLASGK